ncbi:MAG: endonuclease/exonuclease/phosphatase family protein, partial [Myxococcales bacterium]|nr:endonuclease/exonuclease/phosphatase family protein [Myxococcales bacterium]
GVDYRPSPVTERPERRFVRVAAWNIQRGTHLVELKRYLHETPRLRDADVLLLNEVDWGMARSNNLHVARELADHLEMGYLFGNSYLCLDHGDTRDRRVDRPNAESLHGNAILSRFPFRRGQNVSVAISKDKFHSSEKRLGHKKALWAELETPQGRLVVAACHLDSIAGPSQRAAQLRDLLAALGRHCDGAATLIGGDFNTTTYDVQTIPRLLKNIGAKMVRGAFPDAMHHYLHPQQLYEKPVFDELVAAGYQWEPFNAMAVGTTRYEVGTYESESKVRDHLPGIFVRILQWKLKPWKGVAPLKIDWFAGRGVRPARLEEDAGALPPEPIAKPIVDGIELSDHDPIVVDICVDGARGMPR